MFRVEKVLFIFIFFYFFTFFGFSVVEIDSCQSINNALLNGDRKVILNSSIVKPDNGCFSFTDSNYVFDCQNNVIEGAVGYGLTTSNVNNITIQNCIMKNKTFYLNGFGSFTENMNFINITLYNGSIYLKESGVKFNNFRNVTIVSSITNCVVVEDSENNTFEDSSFNCINEDILVLETAINNIFKNNIFLGSTNHIFLDDAGQGTLTSNIFYGNSFFNISKIVSNNWTLTPNNFSYLGQGNTYFGDNSFTGLYCFDEPNNLSCDYFSTIQFSGGGGSGSTSSGASSFPSVSMFSFVLVFIGVFGILFYF